MKKMKKIAIFLICLMMLTNIEMFAHSGRTDAYGGHKDNKNKSGLGSYHYHCGGYPAHLHKNGVCPYKTSSKKTTKKSTKKTTKKTTTTTKKPSSTTVKKEQTKVLAEKITIKEKDIELEVGENKTLTATISPSNVTDKSVTWKSSNEDIIKVNSKGQVTGISKGEAKITAITSNNKEYTITVKVIVMPECIIIDQKDIKIQVGDYKTLTASIYPEEVSDGNITWTSSNEDIVKIDYKGKIKGIAEGSANITVTTVNNKEYTVKVVVEEDKVVQTVSTNIYAEKDYIQNNSDESSVGSALLGYGVVGGAGYIGYKKYKKKKEN